MVMLTLDKLHVRLVPFPLVFSRTERNNSRAQFFANQIMDADLGDSFITQGNIFSRISKAVGCFCI